MMGFGYRFSAMRCPFVRVDRSWGLGLMSGGLDFGCHATFGEESLTTFTALRILDLPTPHSSAVMADMASPHRRLYHSRPRDICKYREEVMQSS